jgi:hypothetical protein
LAGPGGATKVRAYFAAPWPDNPSAGAVQFVDPYAEVRWPSYVRLTGRLVVPNEMFSPVLAADVLQSLRVQIAGAISVEKLKLLPGQCVSTDGYRWGYFTEDRDFCGNPVPHPFGHYVFANKGEPVGPGYSMIEGFDHRLQPSFFHVGLVWSQAFSLSNRTDAITDQVRITRRVKDLKKHWNSYDELQLADRYFEQRDVKGTVRSGASAVEAACRFYAAEWQVPLGQGHQSFNDKIESLLAGSGRPSYRTVNQPGYEALGILYRARNTIHEGDCYYPDRALGCDVPVDHRLAGDLLNAAKQFLFWLDSQA